MPLTGWLAQTIYLPCNEADSRDSVMRGEFEEVTNIKQVAVLAGVSTATVSHVLNNSAHVSRKLRERVLKVVRDLNYHPNTLARSLKTRASKTVGMIITDILNPFYPAVVRGAEDVVGRGGFNLVVGNSDGDVQKEEAYYRTFLAKRVDGLLLVTAATVYPPAYLSRHNSEETPIIFINRDYQGIRADCVIADNLQGSYEAVCHLLKAGHRRVGIITGPREHIMAVQRYLGYERALQAHGVKLEKELVREGRFDLSSGYEQTKSLLTLPDRPTALFVSNVPMTTGALQAIFESTIRFPEELALVSFDDQDWLNVIRPRISAVAQPGYELGASAADMLLKRISGESTGPPCRKLLKTELIVRDSSTSQRPGDRNGTTISLNLGTADRR